LKRDEMNIMVNVIGGKLGWAATSGLLQLRMLFGAKSRDGRGMDTSNRCNGVSRVASIKHRKNGVLLSLRQRVHDDESQKKDV
jgi:hypothetical protein